MQMTPTEKRILSVPRSSADLVKLTLADLHERCSELSAEAFPVFRRRDLRGQRPHKQDKDSGGTEAPIDADEDSGSTGDQSAPTPTPTPPKTTTPQRHSFCKSCQERHPWGRHTKTRRQDDDDDDDKGTETDDNSSQTPPQARIKRTRMQKQLDGAAGPAPLSADRKTTTLAVRLMANAYSKRKDQNKCMRCGKEGHILADCSTVYNDPEFERLVLRRVFSPND